jgi:4-azaleucine resistance transporter AzlC
MMLPLYLGIVPFGLAYAVTARAAGLSVLETCLMSAMVFAGASQFSAAGLFASHGNPFSIILTAFLLNVRHVLYGLSLSREVKLSNTQRAITAYFLTDEAYGMVISASERSFAFVLGAEMSLFMAWNVCTLVGALAGSIITDPNALGVDFVFPLSFLALLIPMLRSRAALIVAAVSGALAFGLSRILPGGLPILLTGIAGSLLGAYLTRDEAPQAPKLEDAVREVA